MTPQLALAGTLFLGILVGSGTAGADCGERADCRSSTQNTERISRDYGRFYFRNNCRYPVAVTLKWASPDGVKVNGWWHIDPESGIYFAVDGIPIQLVSDTFYYYAASTNRRDRVHWKGDYNVRFGNRNLHMRRREAEPDRDGNRSFSVSCDD